MNQETFAEVKDKIIYVLENAAEVKADGRLHEVFLDMVKTFRVYLDDEVYDFHITRYDLEKRGVDLEAVAEAANRNSPILNPPMLYQIVDTPSGVQQIAIAASTGPAIS